MMWHVLKSSEQSLSMFAASIKLLKWPPAPLQLLNINQSCMRNVLLSTDCAAAAHGEVAELLR